MSFFIFNEILYVSNFAVKIAEYFSTFGQIEAVKVSICSCYGYFTNFNKNYFFPLRLTLLYCNQALSTDVLNFVLISMK